MDILTEGCEKLGIHLTEKQEQQFKDYYDLLLEWNSRMNLTSITEYKDVMRKHFLDSLCIVQVSGAELMDLTGVEKMINVGTGAGFPGIPLKIIYPHIELVLLDSLQKRIRFLDALAEKLGLQSVTTVHGRAEEIGRDKSFREQFDLCVSRAVAHMAVLSEYCIPLVGVGKYFVAYKSGKVGEELREAEKAIGLLGGVMKEKKDFVIPGSDMERSLICVEKVRKTSGKYPRKSGVPGKMPL